MLRSKSQSKIKSTTNKKQTITTTTTRATKKQSQPDHFLSFLYHLEDLTVFPVEHLYKDTRLLLPYLHLNLNSFQLTQLLFQLLSTHFAHCRSLYLNDSVSLTLQKLEQVRHFGMISILHLRNTLSISIEVATIIAGFTRLTELDISENVIEAKALMTMLPRLTILKTLYCMKCQHLDDFSMQAIALCCQQHRKLSHIYLTNTSSFSDEGALALFTIGMNIFHTIDISGCNSLTTLAMAGFRKKMSTLRILNLSSIRYIGQSAFEWLSEGCLFLTSLDLSLNSTLDDEGIILIGKRCLHLQSLNLFNCSSISDHGITGFVQNFLEGGGHSLKSLDISGCVRCSAATGFALSKLGNHLKELKLNCLSQITSSSMSSLWGSLKEIEVFEMSADLRSSGTHRRSIIPHISDQIIITGSMNSLRVMNIIGACLVTDIGIRWIVSHSPLIEEIDVSYCNSITDEFLIDLGTFSKQLKSLNISGLGHVSDRGFVALTTGCKGLKKVNCTACNKITNIGMESLKQLTSLEYLNISSCDAVTDDGILSFCTVIHSLKHVNLSHLDLITPHSIHQLIKNNQLLTQLNCIGCNILQIDYHRITQLLPFSMAMTSKCKLEPRHRSVIRYNTYVLGYNQKTHIITQIQSIIRSFLMIRRYHKLIAKRVFSALTIERVWRGYTSRKIISNQLKEVKLYHRQVINLQRKLRKLFAIYLIRKKKKYMLHRLKNVKILQRNIRGFLTRNRLYFRFRNHPKYHKRIFYLIQKLIFFRAIRKVKSQIITLQTNIRRTLQQIKFKKLLTGIKKFILYMKIYYLTNKVTRLISDELIEEWSVKEFAIERIINWYRNLKYNAMLCDYVYECSIVYRNNEDMKEWEYEQQTLQIIKIQTKFRSYSCRKKYFILKKRIKEGSIAIVVIQKYARRFLQQKRFQRWRIKMRRVLFNWKQFYHLILSFFYRKQVKIIQKIFKKYLFLQQRSKAATIINRVARGHLARKRVRGIIHDIHNGLVMRIQRVWKNYKAKKYRRFMYAKRHIAAMRIQRAARRRLEHKAKQRVAAAKKAKALELELQRKEQMLREKRMKVINRIKNTAINQFATRIQRAWRRYKVELDKKLAAKKAREEMMKELALENQQKKDDVLRLPNPLNAARRLIHNFNRFVEQANKVDEKEKPKFTYSVLKYQTLSIKQVGIIDIAMTFGEGERYAFQSRQEFFKSTQKRYFEMLDGDLSGHLRLEIALWIMRGTGTECICELHVKKKPEKSSIAAIKNRVTAKRLDGINIAWHEKVHLEIHGVCSLKRNETGFAIDEIRICHDMESAQQARDDGLFMVQDLLKYSFPTSLWAHGKEQPPDESIFPLVEIEGEVWFDDRMKQSCYKYNLTVEDIYQMRATWDGIQEGSFDFHVSTFAIWDYMNIPRIELCNWLLEAIAPETILQLTFSEYVHLISFFSVFGLEEKIRFIFGHVCTKSHQTLDASQFDNIVEVLTEGFTGQRNLLGWKKEFNRYCHPKLKVMFIGDFEKFVTQHIRILWGFDEIQLKFRTYNLGRNYWEGKNEKFVEVRQKLGFVMAK